MPKVSLRRRQRAAFARRLSALFLAANLAAPAAARAPEGLKVHSRVALARQ